MRFDTVSELMEYTRDIIGRKFWEFDPSNILTDENSDKGILGKLVETGFYGYKNNNIAEADFDSLGIELKVTGFISNKNGTFSAKERLVLSKINYMNIITETFEFSKLIFKNRTLLIIWYEYEEGKPYSEFEIKDYQLYNMFKDEPIFRNDFNIIRNKVYMGQAHLLSEGDTSYLGASTKGAKAIYKVPQPNSEELAKPRAFSLKNSYMTGLLRSIGREAALRPTYYKTVEEYVLAKIQPFIGMTQNEIWEVLSRKTLANGIPKHIGKMISDIIVGKDFMLPRLHDLFRKTTCVIKNLPIDEEYFPLERLSLGNILLSDFDDTWEESRWKTFFEEVTLIVICYEGAGKRNGDRKLFGVRKITFTEEEIEVFGESYEMVRETLRTGDISDLPYPKQFRGQTLVIAPRGLVGADAYRNFFRSNHTDTCFMIEKEFIYSKLLTP